MKDIRLVKYFIDFYSEKRMDSIIKAAVEEEEQISRGHPRKNVRKSSKQNGDIMVIKKSSRSPSSSPSGSPPKTSPINQPKRSPNQSPVMKAKEVKQ